MTTVKNQLRAFYAKQGLTGKHLRMALRHDMKAVARNADLKDWPAWSLKSVLKVNVASFVLSWLNWSSNAHLHVVN